METAPQANNATSCTKMLNNLLNQENDKGAAMMSLVEAYINHFSKRYHPLSFHEQQDVLQEVAIKLICHGEKLQRHCTKSWIYTVVRNQCINHIRDRKRQLSVHEKFKHDQASSYTTGALPLFHDNADSTLVDELDCLEKVFNQVEIQQTGKTDISLYTLYAFGFSYAEIAERSKRTVGAVGTRISVLKKRIKTFIDKHC